MVQMLPQQVMGYDRAITMFSPDGRLLQVEYAKKAVSLGSMALGITCKDGVVLMADKRITENLIIKESVKKIFIIDKQIIATAAGYISDARVLVKRCRLFAQQHKLTYGEKIDVEGIIKYISDMEQAYTQYGGIRPFGISFLMGGIDKKGSQLFLTEPSGIYFKYKAKAIGIGSSDANKMLEEKYDPNITTEQGLKLAKDIFKKILGKKYKSDRIEASIVTKSGVKVISE